MGRPKALKPILIGCACLVPVGLVVGLSVNWNHTIFISATGSSGARGIVNGFGQRYHNDPKHRQFEINAESGGTATGLKDVYSGLCDIGNSTANPYHFVDQWTDMKTFTLGWEGVFLLYKMPSGLSPEAQEAFEISIDQTNINYLLADFSAFNELKDGSVWDETKVYYSNFLTEQAKSDLTRLGELDKCNVSIVPYVRSGGDRSASASIAFSKMSHFEINNLTDEQLNAFSGGQYGNDREYFETDESNAQAWSMFEHNDIPGQMVYMTTSFLNKSNIELFKQKGYKIARYDGVELDTENLSNICTTGGYNWFRPINCSANINNQKAIDFITWIYNCNDYLTYPRSIGIKELDEPQKSTMGSLEFGELVSDVDLDDGNHIYGAKELLN